MYLKLTDRELPVSPVFLDFLNRKINGDSQISTWQNQLDENLVFNQSAVKESARNIAASVLEHPLGKKAVFRAYELTHAFLTGQVKKLKPIRDNYRFIFIVGAPRHGGSYLTKQLFRALGMDADSVPDVIAHDGFPDARPFMLRPRFNSAVSMMYTLAEYLAIAEIYFENAPKQGQHVVIPKKATKFAYHGAFFNDVFGPTSEYVITLRHPIPACISTYEKSGGLPPDGKFAVRGKIEQWAAESLRAFNRHINEVKNYGYFDAYLRYWEHYHLSLAMSGLGAWRNGRVVVYGEKRMKGVANTFYERFGSTLSPEEFHVFDKRDRHTDWRKQSEAAIRRVQAVWQVAGLPFPAEELLEQW